MSASAIALPIAAARVQRPTLGRVKVAIVDDHAVLRTAVRSVLSLEPDLEVVAEADDGAKVLTLLRQTPVDVIMLDLSMPGWSGLEALHAVRARRLAIRILVFTAHPARAYAELLQKHGAAGFLNKSCDPAEIAQAVRAVGSGRRYFQDAAEYEEDAGPDVTPQHMGLSPRQLQLLTRFAQGQSTGAIGRSMGISIKSVTKHRYALLRRLRLRTDAQLTRYALRHELMN
jgi:two-component system invasion response regulator UvrY